MRQTAELRPEAGSTDPFLDGDGYRVGERVYHVSWLHRVFIHGKMMPKRMAKRNDVSQSIVLAP
jgi:hypothetical protein